MYLLIAAIAARTVRGHGRDADDWTGLNVVTLGRSVPDVAVGLFPFAARQAGFKATGARGANVTCGGVG
jgi:hypothetical protein